MSNVDDVIGQLDRLITDINVCMTNGAVSDVEKQEFALLQKQYVETLSTFLAFNRQESLEAEATAGQSAADQGGGGGTGSGDADHLKAC